MLRSTQAMLGYRLDAKDGTIGKVKGLYFDDEAWMVHYVLADNGLWLPGQKVLLSPASFGEPDWNAQAVPVNLNKQQIENAPSISTDRPVSRQYEEHLVSYYDWPAYWAPVGIPAIGAVPAHGARLRQDKRQEGYRATTNGHGARQRQALGTWNQAIGCGHNVPRCRAVRAATAKSQMALRSAELANPATVGDNH